MSKILFISEEHIYTTNPDGTGKVDLDKGWVPVWSPDGRRIAYIDTTYDGGWGEKVVIYVINSDGTGKTELARGQTQFLASPEKQGVLVWSPDGAKIAFGSAYLSILNPDGAVKIDLDETRLDKLQRKGDFAWSPDSKRIAYINEYRNLVVASADGTNETRLVAGAPGPLEWSPDGGKIAYGTGFIKIDGTGEVPLEEWGQTARWSPDGRTIAYIRKGGYARSHCLNIMDLRAGEVATAAVTEGMAAYISEDFSWSPDGKRILYKTWGSGYELGYYIANIGTGETYYFGLQRGMTKPVWSPDADKVFYTDEGYIYIINANGTGRIALAEGSNPQWSPDGKKIAYQFTEKFGKEVLGEYIYVVNADRTGKTKLAEGSNPIWSPAP